MTDREKVIKGFEWLLENMVDQFNDFSFFEYDGPIVLANKPIIADALALLKEQEPRVRTAGEMEKLDERICEWLWIEEKQRVTWNLHCLRTFVYSRHPDNGEFYIMADGYREIVKKEGDEYGKTWRCWTSRPTDEQRKVIPWNA